MAAGWQHEAGIRGWFDRLTHRDSGVAPFYLAPALIFMLALNAYPIFYSLYLSFIRFNLKRPHRTPFIGFKNYLKFLESDYFWNSLYNTVFFVVLAVALVVVIGLIYALVLNTEFRGNKWILGIIIIPWAIPYVANGLMWKWIFNSEYGALNGFLVTVGLFEKYQPFLSHSGRAMGVLIVTYVWKEVPLAAVLFLTAMKAIPEELYRAARVDGASPVKRFFHVTLPGLRVALLIVLVYETIFSVRTFDLVYVLTQGGPGDATSLVSWFTYTETFRNLKMGYGAAISYVIAITTFVLAYWYIKFLYKPTEV